MTEQKHTRVPQFFLTPGSVCPYLPDRTERKVFTRLSGPLAQGLNEALTQSGFRRSQSIAYRPACDTCSACVSVRIVTGEYEFSRNNRRIIRHNRDLVRSEAMAEATREQFALLRTYLDSRHSGGGMSDMSLFDYVAMVEETPVETRLFEYRLPDSDGEPGELIACALSDVLKDGLSMVYSFFHPGLNARSLGTYMILDHIREAKSRRLPHVYLGYWIKQCAKMSYKANFTPIECLTAEGWQRLGEDGT